MSVPDTTGFYSASPQNVTFVATVTLDGAPVTAGSVLFTLMQGNTVVGTAVSANVDSNGVATVSYALPAGQAVGHFIIVASYTGGAATGYSTGTFSLYQASTSTTLATNSPTTYGDDIVLTATVAVTNGSADLAGRAVYFYDGPTFLGVGTLALVEGAYQASYTIPGGRAAGTYTRFTAHASSDLFLLGSSSPNTSHTVLKAPLTITADSFTRYFGKPNPTFTATYTGLVNGDTPSVVTGLNLTTPAMAASLPGNYAITGSGAVAANYAITYAPGVLRVLALPLVAVGSPAGSLPMVSTYDADGVKRTFQAYANAWTGGVRVATGDVNGDGYEDVVTVSGNGTPGIKVFSGRDGAFLTSFRAGGGTYVACADVLRVGAPQVLVGTAAGTVGHVHLFDLRSGRAVYKGAVRAFGPGYRGGVTVAGDFGVLVAGTATGYGTARVFTGAGLATKRDVTPWAGYLGGVHVATAGGLLAVGKATEYADARVYDVATLDLRRAIRTEPNLPLPGYGGVRVAWTYAADGAWTLVVGSGAGWPATTRYYAAATWELTRQWSEFEGTPAGVWVG